MSEHVKEIKSIKDFQHEMQNLKMQNHWGIIKVSGKWCGPCRMIHPFFVKLAADPVHTHIHFFNLDADDVPDLVSKFNISSLPTFVVIKAGTISFEKSFSGADAKRLETVVQSLTPMEAEEKSQGVLTFHTEAEFEAMLKTATQQKRWTIVAFTATWCHPCRIIKPLFKTLADQPKNHIISFVELNIDEFNDMGDRLNVEGMPAFVAFFQGKPVSNQTLKVLSAEKEPEVGVSRNELLNLIEAVRIKHFETDSNI